MIADAEDLLYPGSMPGMSFSLSLSLPPSLSLSLSLSSFTLLCSDGVHYLLAVC